MSSEMDTEISPTDNTEIYRKSTTVKEPLVDHNHLQFLCTYNDDRVLLGAANLTGRFWNGSVWVYDNCSTFQKEKAFVSLSTESVVSDATFVKTGEFAVVDDSGVLQVFVIDKNETSTIEPKAGTQRIGYTCQHDDGILSIAAFDDGAHLVTGGMDCCIKVWNMDELLAEHSYDGAHRKIVTCVDTKPKSNDVFGSTSLDGEAVLWDVRKPNSAYVIYEIPGRQLLSLAWSQKDDNLVVVGGNDGSVTLLDVRKPREFIGHSKLFKKSIYRLKYDPKRPHLLAACCDDTEIKVVDDTKDFATVYHDQHRHSDFVRGIAWQNNNLLTCSWDNTVVKHEISTNDNADVQ